MFANNSTTTFNENRTCLMSTDVVAVMISYSTIYSVLLVASVVGNSLLIYASLKSNIIIASTAASDLLFSIVQFPREIVVQIKGSPAFLVHGWIGSLLCKICAFLADATIAVSTLSLVLMAADRLIAVVFPTYYHRITLKTRRFFIFFTWILAMAIHSPYFYTFRLDERNGETYCITNWEPAFDHKSTHSRYYTALLVSVLIVPVVTVSILQTITLVKLRSDKMAPFRTSIANKRLSKRNKKLLKMSAVIVLAFTLCWLPFIAFQFLGLYFSSSIPRCNLGFEIFIRFVVLLSSCHCTVNPCICFFFIRRFRNIIKPANKLSQRKSSTFIETRL